MMGKREEVQETPVEEEIGIQGRGTFGLREFPARAVAATAAAENSRRVVGERLVGNLARQMADAGAELRRNYLRPVRGSTRSHIKPAEYSRIAI